MIMRFSEETVYIFGAIISLLVAGVVAFPFGKYNLKYYWSSKRKNSANDIITVTIFLLLIFAGFFYIFRDFFHYASVSWILGIGTVAEGLLIYKYLKPLNCRFFEERLYSTTDEKDTTKTVKNRNVPMVNIICGILVLNLGFSMGCISLVRWMMPDVVVIQDGPSRARYEYKVSDYYTLPFERGMKPGGSYIENLSNDTIYRLVVNYGFLGEDKFNYYAVQGKYPPKSLSKMPRRTFHVMDTIAPIMPPSYGRLGRYRTQRIYLTDLEHLWDFKILKMRKFGLVRNKEVDSIKESRNQVLYESYPKYRAYKAIDPYPYPRLRPDSLIRKNNIRYEER